MPTLGRSRPQGDLSPMCIQIGQTAPDFTQVSSRGMIHFYEWLGQSWCLLFSHPRDLTDLCRVEFAEVQHLLPEWDRCNIKVIALSVDNVRRPRSWDDELADPLGPAFDFPMMADSDRTVSDLYGLQPSMANPGTPVRSVMLIDPDRVVRMLRHYPANAERAFADILRDAEVLRNGGSVRSEVSAPCHSAGEVTGASGLPDAQTASDLPLRNLH